MKKILIILLLFLSFGLTSCGPKEDEPVDCEITPTHEDCEGIVDEENCLESEIDVNGVCIDQEVYELQQTYKNTATLSNYQITFMVYSDVRSYTFISQFDDDKSSLEFNGNTEYYSKEEGKYYNYYMELGEYIKEEIDALPSTNMDLLVFLSPEKLLKVDEKLQLLEQYYDEAQMLFNDQFPGCTVDSVVIEQMNDNYYTLIKVTLTTDVKTYRFEFMLSDFDTINITLPDTE